jgi:hypothetical protein
MGKRYTESTPYRDKKCPYCGLYFSPRGLNGHIRFKHPKRIRPESDTNNLMKRIFEEEKLKALARINTEEGLKDALRLFLTEYLTKE